MKEPFSMERVERCTKAYVAKNGKPPTTRPDGWTWNAVDLRLKQEGRKK